MLIFQGVAIEFLLVAVTRTQKIWRQVCEDSCHLAFTEDVTFPCVVTALNSLVEKERIVTLSCMKMGSVHLHATKINAGSQVSYCDTIELYVGSFKFARPRSSSTGVALAYRFHVVSK